MKNNVIIVEDNGLQVGIVDKEIAHQAGILHRSFGVFIINPLGQMLVSKKASSAAHCAGLWRHACSSHPKPDEATKEAAQRKLKENMGLECELIEAYPFIYHPDEHPKKNDHIDPCEYSYAHLFIGISPTEPILNQKELEMYKWIDLQQLLHDVHVNPHVYTRWFRMVIEGVALYIKNFLATKNPNQRDNTIQEKI